jgi:pyoverdine/dityrosine biosynthesis protein Dit1
MLWCRAISKIRFSVCVRATASDSLFAGFFIMTCFRFSEHRHPIISNGQDTNLVILAVLLNIMFSTFFLYFYLK